MNPINSNNNHSIELQPTSSSESKHIDSSVEDKTLLFKQIDIPWYKKVHKISPWFLKCDHKIVKYDVSGLRIWRALLSFSHTILSDWVRLVFILASRTSTNLNQ